MSKINLTLSGELVFEYNEDGSKTSIACLKTNSEKLIYLDFSYRLNFRSGTSELIQVIVFHKYGTKEFKTYEEAVKYILSSLEKEGYEVNEEVVINYDI